MDLKQANEILVIAMNANAFAEDVQATVAWRVGER